MQALFIDGEDKLPHLKDESDQAWTLNELANSYSLRGQLQHAVFVFQNAVALAVRMDDKDGVAVLSGNMADDQLNIGALR